MPTDGKLVVLKFNGDFQQGFQVMLEIGSEFDRPSIELLGALPPNPELALHLFQWQQKNIKRSIFRIAISIAIALISLYGLCFLSLLRGTWVQFVSSV
ncbi:MAG: hypothetical protein F6K28_48380, partial [Microcoleus sp. SIO2G3]|nr:hypothetical protein [Microcoleus sp. SIO2G3]